MRWGRRNSKQRDSKRGYQLDIFHHIPTAAQDSVAATLRLWLLDVEADCRGFRHFEMANILICGFQVQVCPGSIEDSGAFMCRARCLIYFHRAPQDLKPIFGKAYRPKITRILDSSMQFWGRVSIAMHHLMSQNPDRKH